MTSLDSGQRKGFLGGGMILAVFATAVLSLPIYQRVDKESQGNQVEAPAMLSASHKAELAETLRLKAEIGDQVWTGLAATNIPVILFNEGYEFLVGEANPPGLWKVVEGDDFQGVPYYRRAAQNPQAFAVKVGATWAGSAPTLDHMNRKIPFKLSPEFHVVVVLHEIFHAYQANQAPKRFAKANAVYAAESRYPYKDADFRSAWNDEGRALAEALKTKDDAPVKDLVRRFLQIRETRRKRAALGSDLLAFERELEWLEGLAKYAEIKFYEIAASRSREASYGRYGTALPFPLQWDFVRLEKTLGTQDGDLRFYLSGLAQARLLDRLSPQWKARAMQEDVYLEDLVRESVGVRSK